VKVRITLLEEMLGTASANPDIHKEFIASKSADADKVEEELASLPASELENKSRTVFHRDPNGKPIIYDYQIKGFLKEAVGILLELTPGEIRVGKSKLSKFTFKRMVDNFVFVTPRQIALNAEVGANCVRPLRADTMRGERVSLACSETIPAGTSFECEVDCLADSMVDLLRKALDYGRNKGLGQWRNSGKGRFSWEEVK
jgi:hypothetical protein